MFSQLQEGLHKSLDRLRGVGRLNEENIKESLSTIRTALLEADVALSVCDRFLESVKTQALGEKVLQNVRPGDALIKLVNDELASILGDESAELNLSVKPPMVILLAGLQGAGKTTTAGKLAHYLKTKEKKSLLLVSTDIYRPAAMEQLERLSEQVGVDYFQASTKDAPKKIAQAALSHAKKHFHDVVIIDTAGRLHIDQDMMSEVSDIHQATQANETLLVVDSMTGQDAANIAKTFNDALPLSGVILTKTDGDARGGAALSMRMITGKPILFIGTGEKIHGLERFHPKRVASSILGMGDIVSLVEDANDQMDKKKQARLAQKIKKGKKFDFNDFLEQLQQMKKMGSMEKLMKKLPNMPAMPSKAKALTDGKQIAQMEAIVCSMTLKERLFPALLNGSRKRRIAAGSGTTIQDVNKLLKQFMQMQKMLKRFKGGKMMSKFNSMRDQLPPELQDQLPKDF